MELLFLFISWLPAASQPDLDSASPHCKPAAGLEETSTDQKDLWPAPVNSQDILVDFITFEYCQVSVFVYGYHKLSYRTIPLIRVKHENSRGQEGGERNTEGKG